MKVSSPIFISVCWFTGSQAGSFIKTSTETVYAALYALRFYFALYFSNWIMYLHRDKRIFFLSNAVQVGPPWRQL